MYARALICYNNRMDQERLMDLLRNPQKYQKKTVQQQAKEVEKQAAAVQHTKQNNLATWVGIAVFGLVAISLFFLMISHKKVENISASLDPKALSGLAVEKAFTPNVGKRYVQVAEGHDRSVTVQQLGSTLPVVSRYNFRALTPRNYEVIGAAPWALSVNVSSNLEDPDMLRYLFNQQNTINGFLKRKDVAPYLADPKELAKLAGDETALQTFFADKTVQDVLASEKLVEALAGSRLFAYLLISKAGKYYRDNPAEAAKLIQASPTLSGLKQNANVRKAVQENTYLKDIAAVLLK